MKQLLGFAVLTGPLFLIVPWTVVCLVLAFFIGKNIAKRSLPIGITVAVLLFAVVLPLPIADEIAGRIYFNRLCEKEAGVKVYKTIELPAEYWDEDGKPKFYDENTGNFTLPSEKFYKVDSKKGNRRFGVQERRTFILNINTNKIIGEKLLFRYWGGYILKNFTPHNSAMRCGSDWHEFVEKQFIQTMAKGGE